MVKSGMADDPPSSTPFAEPTQSTSILPRPARSISTASGVSPRVLLAMKTQAAKKPAPKPAVHKGLNNTQVIAMVKAGMDDGPIEQAVNGADAIDFDLSPAASSTDQQRRQRPRSGCDEGPSLEEADGNHEAVAER